MGVVEVFTKVKDRVEQYLNEDNMVTRLIGKLEEKTGVKKKILVFGMYTFLSTN